jgi:hypothetical protein
MKRMRMFLVLLAIWSFSTTARAQVATGTPPFGSFSGGSFDTVNNANLNDHFSIPVVGKAGRGLQFHYALNYNNSVWKPVTSNGFTNWEPVTNWGWNNFTQSVVGFVTSLKDTLQSCQGTQYDSLTNWIWVDTHGTVHPFPAMLLIGDTSPPSCATANEVDTAYAPDGSGLKLSFSKTNGFTVTTAGGETITTSSMVFAGGNGGYLGCDDGLGDGPGTVTDPNGNSIAITDNCGGESNSLSLSVSVTDTLGTNALQIGNSPPGSASGIRFNYTDASGASQYILERFTTYTVQTNFGCSGDIEFGPLTESLVSEIDLPDGTDYRFTYETTPGDAHTPHYVTGRIASVTLPTGGTISYAYTSGLVTND